MKTLTDRQLSQLKKFLQKESAVELAFLFGSAVAGRGTEESDIDIGVWLSNLSQEDKLWSDLSRLLQQEVDLVVLNKAPASLILKALQSGAPLTVKDQRLYWDLYLRASSEVEDFLEFMKSYQEIADRAKSLASEDAIRLRERYNFLKNEFQDLKEYKAISQQEFAENKKQRLAMERWAERMINATIDIAKLMLASEKKPVPRTYEEALLYFAFMAGFEDKEANHFARFARLRNLLAHEYLDILYARIQKFIKASPDYYPKIFKFIESRLK